MNWRWCRHEDGFRVLDGPDQNGVLVELCKKCPRTRARFERRNEAQSWGRV